MMERSAFVASMAAFATTLSVPTRHVPALMDRLAKAGLLVLDTGERVSTEEGFAAEALLHVADIATVQFDEACELGVPQ